MPAHFAPFDFRHLCADGVHPWLMPVVRRVAGTGSSLTLLQLCEDVIDPGLVFVAAARRVQSRKPHVARMNAFALAA